MMSTNAGRPAAKAVNACAVADVFPSVKAPRSNSTETTGPPTTINAAVADINALERTLKARVPNLKWLFIEPDVTD